MKRTVAGIALGLELLWPHGARAEPTASPVGVCGGVNTSQCQGQGSDGAFTASGGAGSPGAAGHGGGPARPVNLPATYRIYDYAPTCTGNTRGDADALCGAAVNSCLPRNTGQIRYWVWYADVDRATGKIVDPPGWVFEPKTVCLGPTQQGLPTKAAIGGVLASDFQQLVVVKGVAHVDPKDATLVNFETGFWTDAKAYQLAPVQILGHTVVVTAKPERFDWYFGDGATAQDAGPGRSRTTDVSHTYDATGTVRPYVVITWSGTFTVDGGAPLPVIGTAVTTGDGTPLQVKEAHAQLVS